MEKYKTLVCGGTFDHLHAGHTAFLQFGLSRAERLVIGLTTDAYVKQWKPNEEITVFALRKNALLQFFQEEGVSERITIIPISDPFGPTLDPDFFADGLLVSAETEKGGQEINKKRQEKGLKPMALVTVPLLKQFGKRVAAGDIRRGSTDREGKPWVNPVWMGQTLQLPELLRRRLKTPLGEMIQEEDLKKKEFPLLVTVGDIVTKTANQLHLSQALSIVDFVVQRQKTYSRIEELGFLGSESLMFISNTSGTINTEVFPMLTALFQTEKKRTVLLVNGEEDLLVLPVILTAPLSTGILYGQPKRGMVLLEITEALKEEAYRIVDAFHTTGH